MDRRRQAVKCGIDLMSFVKHPQVLGERRLQFGQTTFAAGDGLQRLGQPFDFRTESGRLFQSPVDFRQVLFLSTVHDGEQLLQALVSRFIVGLMAVPHSFAQRLPVLLIASLLLVELVEHRLQAQSTKVRPDPGATVRSPPGILDGRC